MDKVQSVLAKSKKYTSTIAWYTILAMFVYFSFCFAIPLCLYCTFKSVCAFGEMGFFMWMSAMVLILTIDVGVITFAIHSVSDLYDLIKKQTTK